MFGSSINNNTSNSGGGLFGSSSTNQGVGGGLFGNKPGSTPVFGSQQPQQPQQQNAFGSSNTSGGLFGQSQSNSTGSTGLFGSNQSKPSTGLFGSNPSSATTTAATSNTGNMFGSGNAGFGAKPASTGGGLFGNNSQPNTGTSMFGNNAQSNTGTNLFGNQQSNTGTSGGGLFGASANKPPATGTTGGLFGSQQPSTGGLFGNNQRATTGTTSGGLFGNNQSSATNTTSGLFGNKPSTSTGGGGLFGSSTNSQGGGGGLFGQNTTNTGGAGLFGQQQQQQPQQQQQQSQPTQQSSLFSSNTTNNQQPSFSWSKNPQTQPSSIYPSTSLFGDVGQGSQQANANPSSYTPAINDQLTKVWEQWDPNSAKCGLKTHFYNKFNDQEIGQLLAQPRPANETVEDWDKAMSERPGPNFFPVKITSFTEVAQRIEAQLDQVAKSRVLLNTINERLNTLSAKHDLENTTRILKAKARHTQLSRRLLRLATVLAILKLKGYPLLPEEEEIARQFDILTAKINDPNSPIGKLGDIFAKLAVLKERAEDLNSQFDQSMHKLNGSLGNENPAKESKEENGNTDDVINKIAKVLLKQQMGLNYLNSVLEKDSEKVQSLIKFKSK
ncbi:uncharacterized protein LODBEIA_P09820 [Lodderomyces beijingensis]|uniref:Nucleoporin Nup54 alpha-helical domain-containing protein n=1 Tax=Lodderomyces beijingensis TaxID=1775926 RepID=A0ABP0ZF27_9ASCO